MDNLPSWDIYSLNPTFIDGLQYSEGTYTDVGGWIGSFSTAPHLYGGAIGVYAATQVYRSGTFSPDQWVAYQTIVPLDDAPGSSVAVRCSNGNGYFLHNMAYTSDGGWWFSLYRFNNGTPTLLAQWEQPSQNPDGAFVILEVCGTNPVKLRASWAMSPWGPPYSPSQEGPHEFPAQATYPVLLGTYNDSSASRILTGVPGFGYNFSNTAGGCYGFNAGKYNEFAIDKLITSSTMEVLTLIFAGGVFSIPKMFTSSVMEGWNLVQPPGLARTLTGEAQLLRLDGSVPEIYTLGGSRWN